MPVKIRRSRRRKRYSKRERTLFVGALVALVLLLAGGWWLTRSRPVAQDALWKRNVLPSGLPPIKLAWSYRPTTFEEPTGMTVQAPTWLYVQADSLGKPVLRDLGQIGYTDFNAQAYVASAHGKGCKVWVTVVSFDPELSRQIVADGVSRVAFAAQLSKWAQDANVDGICFDFEKMNPADKDSFTALVKATKNAALDMTITVAVTVPLGYEDNTNWYQCYDREALAQTADYLELMCYDAHTDSVQPVAPLSWVKKSVERTLKTIPSNKLLLGIPFYGVDFYQVEGSDSAIQHRIITSSDMDQLLAQNSYIVDDSTVTVQEWLEKGTWQEEWGINVYRFIDMAGYTHTIWMEDGQSIAAKTALVDTYGLSGVAVWQQSQGTEALWAAVDQTIGKDKEP
jgi:spore germination protein YaaH